MTMHRFPRAGFWPRYLITVRPWLCLVSGSAGLVGLALAPNIGTLKRALGGILFLGTYGLGQALTDTTQTDTDALSAPERPLPRGELHVGDVRRVSLAGLTVFAIVFGWMNPWTLLVSGVAVIGAVTYAPLKRRWWGGPPWNSWIVAFLVWIGVLVGGGDPVTALSRPGVLAAMGSTFFGYAVFVLIGYLKDVDSDRQTGYQPDVDRSRPSCARGSQPCLPTQSGAGVTTTALVALNPAAHQGAALRRFAEVRPLLARTFGISVVETTANDSWKAAVEEALDSGTRVFLAAGGDGTVHRLAGAILAARGNVPLDDISLGGIGLGSSNDFHKPVTAAVNGIPVRVDVDSSSPRDVLRVSWCDHDGVRHDDVVMVRASFGVTAAGNALFNKPGRTLALLKTHWTGVAILWAALRTLIAWSDLPARLAIDDERLLAVNVDSVVEEVRAGLYDPFLAGYMAVVAALSDLAAVGAETLGVLLSVTLPGEGTEEVQAEVARGAREACEAAGTFVLGGDTNEGPDLAMSCTAVGTVPDGAARLRVGAQPGDDLWVTGPLGAGSALAAHVLLGVPESVYSPDDFRPQPRLREGIALRGLTSAGMDTSDGLVATLDQIARLNDVRLVVDGPLERLLDPRVEGLRQLGLPALALLAGHHGEFELVFTAPARNAAEVEQIAENLGGCFLKLGRVEVGSGLIMGGVEVDAAALRNLLQDVGGDPHAYVTELVRRTSAWA